METPTPPKTAQVECVEKASCEKTALKMKVSFTEPPKPSLQVQLPELALLLQGQEEPLHCQQLHNGKSPFYAPFEPTLNFLPNRGCVPDPESIPHARCVTLSVPTPLLKSRLRQVRRKDTLRAIFITQLFSSKPQGRSSLLALSNYANDP